VQANVAVRAAAPNPVFSYSGSEAGLPRAFQQFLQQTLVQLRPAGGDIQPLWHFESRAEFIRCFARYDKVKEYVGSPLSELLVGLAIHPAVKLGWDFDWHSPVWHIEAAAAKPWTEVLPEIEAILAAPTLEESFGLSSEAASLLEWTRNLAPDKLLLGCTPVVEEAMRRHALPLGGDWPAHNLPALFEILCEEISERTPYRLKAVRWDEHGQRLTRLRLGRPATSLAHAARSVQEWLRQEGTTASPERIQESLAALKSSAFADRTPA